MECWIGLQVGSGVRGEAALLWATALFEKLLGLNPIDHRPAPFRRQPSWLTIQAFIARSLDLVTFVFAQG
jgi:hypothetical protein